MPSLIFIKKIIICKTYCFFFHFYTDNENDYYLWKKQDNYSCAILDDLKLVIDTNTWFFPSQMCNTGGKYIKKKVKKNQ